MRELTRLDSNPKQELFFTTDEKETIRFYFYFLPTQDSWFVDVECGEFKLYGTRVCVLPNLFNKYSNIIKWGLNVATLDGLDPTRVTDFVDGYASVSVLDKSEVQHIEDILDGKIEPDI